MPLSPGSRRTVMELSNETAERRQLRLLGAAVAKHQVEVYDPSGNAGSRLVLAGKIVPVS